MAAHDTFMSKDHLRQLELELEKQDAANNTFTVSEFKRYLPLWQKGSFEKIDRNTYGELCGELCTRINMYKPICVVTDDLDANGMRQLVLRLPAWFNRVRTVNERSQAGATTLQKFSNSLIRDNPLSTDVDVSALHLHNILSDPRLDPVNKRELAEYAAIMDDLNVATNDAASGNTDKTSSVEFVWEED